jgi:CBS domain-containing protein
MSEITDIMTADVMTVEKGTPVMEAIRKLAIHNVTGMPVVDEHDHVIGIVSEKDVLALAIRIYEKSFDSNAANLLVEDFMTNDVITIEATESITALCTRLMKSSFRRVPVVVNKKLVGIVSRKNVIAYILEIQD